MGLTATQSAANLIQAEWKRGQMSDKIKLIQRAEKLGATFAGVYTSVEDIEELSTFLVDRELKISFLKGFEASLGTGIPVTEDVKNYLHYEILRHKR